MIFKSIDLNSDVGEQSAALLDGSEEALIRLITSANIACGGHAGDEESMKAVLRMCATHNVSIGAHPSYPDRKSFGRKRMDISSDALVESVYSQVSLLCSLADAMGMKVRHIKPHGALYNSAAKDEEIARSIASGVRKVGKEFVLFGLAGSKMLDVWAAEGFAVVAEGFVDRRYERDGSLRSRDYPDALIVDPRQAADQALTIATEQKVTAANGSVIEVSAQTLCLHSDTPSAVQIATTVRAALVKAGIQVKAN